MKLLGLFSQKGMQCQKNLISEKTREIAAAYSYNKKVRNNQCKLLGVTLIIAYLYFNNNFTKKYLHRKMYSARLLSKFEKNGM